MATVGARLAELAISLPAPATPGGAYAAFVQTGNLVFVSGHIAKRDGQPWTGRLGADLTVAQGRAAARATAIDLLGTLQAAVGGLDRVRRIVKLLVLVNSTPDFTEQPAVADGASELLTRVFGESGLPARSAVGATALPRGACVEIELVAEVAPPFEAA